MARIVANVRICNLPVLCLLSFGEFQFVVPALAGRRGKRLKQSKPPEGGTTNLSFLDGQGTKAGEVY